MKAARDRIVFCLICLAFSAAGWLLALSAHVRRPNENPATGKIVAERSSRGPADVAADTDPNVAAPWMPLPPDLVRKRAVTRMSTAELWSMVVEIGSGRPLDAPSYDENDPPVPRGPQGPDPWTRDRIFRELVDRLGWAVWDRAQALEKGDAREYACCQVLDLLAEQDALRAFGLWKEHRGELPRSWVARTPSLALDAAAKISAPAMMAVVTDASGYGSTDKPEYAPDFDFAAMLDCYLTGPGARSRSPFNLGMEWARRSPLEAAQWLADHAEQLQAGEWSSETGNVAGVIFHLPPETPGREEALRILHRYSAE